jgi:hypothetical protein
MPGEIFAGNEYVHGGSLIDGVSNELLVFIGLAVAFVYVYKTSNGEPRQYLMDLFGMQKSNMADFRKFDAQIGDGKKGAVAYNESF